VIEQNSAPVSIADASSHARSARTGHVSGFDPYGTPTLRPSPSWFRLGAPQSRDEAIAGHLDVIDVQRDQFGAAEGASEPEQ
jgi:hypothetical protein